MKSIPTTVWVLLLALVFVISCSDNDATTIWDPNEIAPINPPEISSINPEGSYLAGIDAITINGSGFSINAEDNSVYFSNEEENGVKGLTLSANENSLTVRPPLLFGNVTVQVMTQGAENFSNVLNYTLEPPITNVYGAFNANAQTPVTFALDSQENVFISMLEPGSTLGVIRVDSQTEAVSTFVLPNNRFRWDAIDFTTDGRLYICLGIRAVFLGLENSREAAHFIMPNPFTFSNFDMDEYGYMWLVGNNEYLVRHIPQTERVNITSINSLPDHTKIFPFVANVRSIRYYDNKLYLLGSDAEGFKVWTLDLNENQEPINQRVLIDLNTKIDDFTTGNNFSDMAIASDGYIYIATNRVEGIFSVSPDGQEINPLYEGVIYPSVTALEWGEGPFLYATTIESLLGSSRNSVIKINMQKTGSTNF